MSELQEYALWLCWTLLTLTSSKIKNPVHDLIFTTQQVMEGVLAAVTFAPGLLDALQSTVPPTIAFFKSLPADEAGIYLFGVYLIVLERVGHRPKIYIGSGTDYKLGMRPRMRQYDAMSVLPRYVQQAVDAGYTITHRAILCSSPLPSSATRYPLRALYLIIETALAFTLGAMHNRSKTYGMPDLLCWKAKDLTYDGCCSHTAIYEAVQGEYDGLSLEQIAVKDALLDARRKEQEKASQAKFYAKISTTDWMRRRQLANQKRTRDRIIAAKTHWCPTCKEAFQSKGALKTHNTRIRYKDKVKLLLSQGKLAWNSS